MKHEVHQWSTRVEYFDIEDGTEITKATAVREYITLRKRKSVKIENFRGTITWTCECIKQPQLRIWGNQRR